MRRFALPFVVSLSLFGVNCAQTSSTQLVVLMDTDYPVPEEVDRVRARVAKVVESEAGSDEVETWLRVFRVSSKEQSGTGVHTLPATFSVLPSGADIDREIVVQLDALATGSDEVLATRRVRTGFIRGQARLVRMLIYRACAELSCPDGESCGCPGGTSCATPSCVDESLPPEELEIIDNPALLPPDSEFPISEGTGDGGTQSDGGVECEPPLTLCNLECVDTDSDARYCGGCNIECPSGYVCDAGVCSDPSDCRTNGAGCTGFTYCDETTGDCLRGCTNDEQCTGNQEICEVETHECICSPGFERCAFDCVDTQADPRFCGGCMTWCPAGEVCEAGICVDPGDCRMNGSVCTGFTYCDEITGDCLRGCEENTQCVGKDQVCNASLHQCVCATGFHECGGVCVSDLNVDTCGASCTPCPAPSRSTPTCNAGVCDFVCDDGLDRCGSNCVDTQIDPRFCGDCLTACLAGEVCEAGACLDPGDCRTNGVGCSGFTYCDQTTGDCLPGCENDTQCDGENQICNTTLHECVCAMGFHQCAGACVSDLDVDTCGASCNPCPAPPSSTPTCNAGVCDFICDDDFERCDDVCCPTSCPPGEILFEQSCAAFHVRTADDRGNVGEYSSIALDAAEEPRIAYYARNGKNLLYSVLPTGGVWLQETADAPGDVGRHASLAIDPAGNPRIAYYDADNSDLLVVTRQAGGGWITEIVDSQGDVGQYASLAFDPSGTAHIAYYDAGNKSLVFATQLTGGGWTTEIVDNQGDVGQYASLAFDPTGRAHIAYYDAGNKSLVLATQLTGGGWTTEIVDNQGDVGQYASLAFDPTGTAHIAYYDAGNKSLVFSTQLTGGGWITEIVDGQRDVGQYASLAFDSSGTAHISYFDETGLDLKHAIQKPGQTWALETIDSAGEVGRFTSIAVDAEGQAHISYYDATNTNLKYAIVAAP
jgi:hypothetical protein